MLLKVINFKISGYSAKKINSMIVTRNYLIPAVVLFVLASLSAAAQNRLGITGNPDTSYATYSAYINTKQTNPEISIVPELKSDAVKEQRNVTYCTIGNRKLLLDIFSPVKKSTAKKNSYSHHSWWWLAKR